MTAQKRELIEKYNQWIERLMVHEYTAEFMDYFPELGRYDTDCSDEDIDDIFKWVVDALCGIYDNDAVYFYCTADNVLFVRDHKDAEILAQCVCNFDHEYLYELYNADEIIKALDGDDEALKERAESLCCDVCRETLREVGNFMLWNFFNHDPCDELERLKKMI